MLIGRSRELEQLVNWLAGPLAGRGATAVLSGEPGIGKSCLLDEVAQEANQLGFRVAWGRAWETGGAPAYFPWGAALTSFRELRQPTGRVEQLLERAGMESPREGMRTDPARERFELFEEVTGYLVECARLQPLLLVFDDAHAADLASLELLVSVARGLKRARVAILVGQRDAEARLPGVADVLSRLTREALWIALPRLRSEDVAELVRHTRGEFDAALSQRVYQLTEGNPLFVREVLQSLAARGAGDDFSLVADVASFGGVHALVRGRLSATRPELQAELELAATLGRDVAPSLFAEALDIAPVDALRILEEGRQHGFLTRRDERHWMFSHVLVREAFYQELAEERRRALHARIVHALRRRVLEQSRTEWLAPLAHHALSALPLIAPREAVAFACAAAERARAELAYESALALLERGLVAAETFGLSEPAHAELLLALGWAATEAGQLARGRAFFRDAAVLARGLGDPLLLGRAALGQGGQYVLAETRSELVDVLREALRALEPARPSATGPATLALRARLLARLAAALTPSPTPQEPLALAHEALALQQETTDLQAQIDIDVGVGAAFADYAPPLERIPVNERLRRNARAAGDRMLELRALTRLACDYLERGELAQANAAIEARMGIAHGTGHPRTLWQNPLLQSMACMPDGRFDEAEQRVDEARRLVAQCDDPNAPRCLEMHRFNLLLMAGRLAGLDAQRAQTQAALTSLPDGAALCTWAQAITCAHLGQPERARALLNSLGPSNVLTSRMSRSQLLESALLARCPEVYEPLYSSFAADDDSNGGWGPFAFVSNPPIARLLGAVAFARGQVAAGGSAREQNYERARQHMELAQRTCERTGGRAHRAWLELSWGEGLRDDPEGRPHLEHALALARQLEMPAVVARAEHALEACSSRPASHSASPVVSPLHAFELTRTEHGFALQCRGRTFALKELRGLHMLVLLLEQPGRELHVLDLVGDAREERGGIDLGDAGALLDARAREAYRQRVVSLREELAEAEACADLGRIERRRSELELLQAELARAVGLGGRERRAGSAAERARVVVQRRLREAIRKLGELDPELGKYLDWSVRTGLYCAYEPGGRRSGPGRGISPGETDGTL